MASTIWGSVENKLKSKSDTLFKDLTPDTIIAPYVPLTEKELLAKLQRSREQTVFRNADAVISDMKSKYGL